MKERGREVEEQEEEGGRGAREVASKSKIHRLPRRQVFVVILLDPHASAATPFTRRGGQQRGRDSSSFSSSFSFPYALLLLLSLSLPLLLPFLYHFPLSTHTNNSLISRV